MMSYLKKRVLLFLIASFLAVPMVNAQDVVIIANSDVPAASLAAADIQNIYLGNKTSWENGSKINFITMQEESIEDAFLKAYVGRSSAQYKTYWKKQVFTGKGKMPQSVGSDQEMVDLVSGTSGAIGYVSAGADRDNAKTISIQ